MQLNGESFMRNNTDPSDNRRLILVVEDEEINRTILGTILEKDYDVIFASDCTEALKKIEDIDRHRADYYGERSGMKWGRADNYDICINTSSI